MTDGTKPYPLITSAIRDGRLSETKDLLRRFPEMKNLDVPGFGNWLIYSSAHGTADIVKYLIGEGFPVNARDKRSEQNALSTASSYGRADIVDILLNNDALLEIDSSTINPLFSSIIGRSIEVANKILSAGIDTKVQYTFGRDVKAEFDAVAFAMMQGEREIAHAVALKNSGGDEADAQIAMQEGLRLAHLITSPPE